MKQFAVIGLGRFGSAVATTLAGLGHQVLAIDRDEKAVEAVMDRVTQAVQADAQDEESLKATGVRNVDVAVVAIGENVQANILVTMLLKEMGVRCVVAKAVSDLQGKVLAKAGADRVVFPERDMGVRVAHTLASGNVLEHIDISPDFGLMEIVAPSRFVGKTLGQMKLRAEHGVSVVAMKKRDNSIIAAPGADDKIDAGDVMVVTGSNKALARLQER